MGAGQAWRPPGVNELSPPFTFEADSRLERGGGSPCPHRAVATAVFTEMGEVKQWPHQAAGVGMGHPWGRAHV